MDCDKAYQEGAKKVGEYYKPILDENNRIINNMSAKGLDPKQYYDAKNDQIINLVAFQTDIQSKITAQINDLRAEVDEKCGKIVDILQFALDSAIGYYTDGITLILPKHMTHIDMAEILKGNIAGGENSFVNEVKNKLYSSMGMGENNDLRKLLDTPVDAVKDFFSGLGIHL
ncbi:hypothetical protein HDF26_003299 [Pedobacter cryoconitis]|uniref:Uncharacterized protein n=1 Tax=Pedobacter cryoconitis TaxID=188932 RepID=A0A7W8ZLJ9_9SPHI|nr:hypothetical protein [Pedobacter cryoconitis]MBB5636243.1 hypothetical protein [Pedobacter cryoconitis]MBB6272839.1 hypothetical protein [Pedobacter cryoconitis]